MSEKDTSVRRTRALDYHFLHTEYIRIVTIYSTTVSQTHTSTKMFRYSLLSIGATSALKDYRANLIAGARAFDAATNVLGGTEQQKLSAATPLKTRKGQSALHTAAHAGLDGVAWLFDGDLHSSDPQSV